MADEAMPGARTRVWSGVQMPQLVFAAGIGFSNGSDFLKPTSTTAAGNLIIPPEECDRAVKKFLGSAPPHKPACSPPS